MKRHCNEVSAVDGGNAKPTSEHRATLETKAERRGAKEHWVMVIYMC